MAAHSAMTRTAFAVFGCGIDNNGVPRSNTNTGDQKLTSFTTVSDEPYNRKEKSTKT